MRRLARIAATGSAFAIFGLGGVLLGNAILPLTRAWPGSTDRRTDRGQRLVHLIFRAFVAYMKTVGILDVEVLGAERLRSASTRGKLVLANHPSLIDVVLLIAEMPQADCVVKRELFQNPFLRRVVSGAGYLANDGGPELTEAIAERLRRGRSLLLFPEGTRSPMRGLGPFQRGAAHVVLDSGCDVVTVTIACEPPSLMRGQAWWDVPPRRMQFRIDAMGEWHRCLPTDERHGRGFHARALTADLRRHFAERLGHADT